MVEFDPNAAATPGSGIFGLPHGREDADVVLVPVPFDATTSYREGTAAGPRAILEASKQVDLHDLQTGRPYRRGIHLLPIAAEIEELNRRARARARPLIERGGATAGDEAAVAQIDAAGARVNELVEGEVTAILAAGKLPGVLGGDHSVSFGAIRAVACRHERIGVLHVDAHADLRQSYEGMRWSHASIMDNVLREVPAIERLVQVGIRDLSDAELDVIQGSDGRVVSHFDIDWQRRMAGGEPFSALCDAALVALPELVHVSFDVDGLDPAYCPHAGTPVPGGLTFVQACLLLERLVESGRRIVGFDLTEVAPGPDGDEWDAAVGARLLYKLCGFALLAS